LALTTTSWPTIQISLERTPNHSGTCGLEVAGATAINQLNFRIMELQTATTINGKLTIFTELDTDNFARNYEDENYSYWLVEEKDSNSEAYFEINMMWHINENGERVMDMRGYIAYYESSDANKPTWCKQCYFEES
jgi:hypothetical protein